MICLLGLELLPCVQVVRSEFPEQWLQHVRSIRSLMMLPSPCATSFFGVASNIDPDVLGLLDANGRGKRPYVRSCGIGRST